MKKIIYKITPTLILYFLSIVGIATIVIASDDKKDTKSSVIEIIPIEDQQKVLIEIKQQIQSLNAQRIGAIRTIATLNKIDLSKCQVIEQSDGSIKFICPEKKVEAKP
jgi:hypothetical protein